MLVVQFVFVAIAGTTLAEAEWNWTTVPNVDAAEGASCVPNSSDVIAINDRPPALSQCVLNSSTSSWALCQQVCQGVPNCTIFSWNERSHHCYTNCGGVWKPLSNDHVISGCMFGRALGCPQPTPAPPSPAPPPPSPPTPSEPSTPRMVSIDAGVFTMGYSHTPLPPGATLPNFPNGDSDESPAHSVHISAFEIGVTEVTNRQYELFDPSHREFRGKLGFSTGDNEAVVFVSWYDAVNYTKWLSKRTGRAYSLPTEAEWEYAARGNSTATMYSPFWTGDSIPAEMLNNPKDTGIPTTSLPLGVARFAGNGFGLHDTLGNVEEWVADWHGPYTAESVEDPLGPPNGVFRGTRGGSHSTDPYYLRTANRAGALPSERSWYIGFRVVANGAASNHLDAQQWLDSNQESPRTTSSTKTSAEPSWPEWSSTPISPIVRRYVNWPGNGSRLPFSDHNHEPTIAACPDGSVYANWYSTNCGEEGRCVGLVDARLTPGADNWTTAKVQLDAPDRCQCCTALYLDRQSGTLYHFSAMSAAGTFSDIIGTLQWSTDCGESWTSPKIIWPNHGIEHQIVVTIIQSTEGELLVPCDHWGVPPYQYEGDQSVVQHAALVNASDPSAWSRAAPRGGSYNNTGSHHTSIVSLRNGSFLSVGRAHDINGTMPMSYSLDGGHTWHPHQSPFTGIHGGQREVMIRLGSIDQPLMHCTYANGPPEYRPTFVESSAGSKFEIIGLYCAVSYDDGESWPNRRTITDDFTLTGKSFPGFDGNNFTMAYNKGEPNGYMAATVAENGIIHLITSRNSYSFNLAWLASKPDPPQK